MVGEDNFLRCADAKQSRRKSGGPGGHEIRQSTIYYAGWLGRWDKRIVDLESDVPSIIFF